MNNLLHLGGWHNQFGHWERLYFGLGGQQQYMGVAVGFVRHVLNVAKERKKKSLMEAIMSERKRPWAHKPFKLYCQRNACSG